MSGYGAPGGYGEEQHPNFDMPSAGEMEESHERFPLGGVPDQNASIDDDGNVSLEDEELNTPTVLEKIREVMDDFQELAEGRLITISPALQGRFADIVNKLRRIEEDLS